MFSAALNYMLMKNTQNLTLRYSTKSNSKPWLPSWISFSVVPSASTENSPFHFSNSNAAASSSLAFLALASSSYNRNFVSCHRANQKTKALALAPPKRRRQNGITSKAIMTHQQLLLSFTFFILLPSHFCIMVLFHLPWFTCCFLSLQKQQQ